MVLPPPRERPDVWLQPMFFLPIMSVEKRTGRRGSGGGHLRRFLYLPLPSRVPLSLGKAPYPQRASTLGPSDTPPHDPSFPGLQGGYPSLIHQERRLSPQRRRYFSLIQLLQDEAPTCLPLGTQCELF